MSALLEGGTLERIELDLNLLDDVKCVGLHVRVVPCDIIAKWRLRDCETSYLICQTWYEFTKKASERGVKCGQPNCGKPIADCWTWFEL